VRPKTPAYESVSITISSTLHPPASASANLPKLPEQLQDAIESKGLIP
jgi:multiple sugar transport system substrate-binding protein